MMRPRVAYSWFVVLCAALPFSCRTNAQTGSGNQVSGRVVDKLGRPIPGVTIRIVDMKTLEMKVAAMKTAGMEEDDDDWESVSSATLTSGKDGRFSYVLSRSLESPIYVFEKDGYAGIAMFDVSPKLGKVVMERAASEDETVRLPQLSGKELDRALIEILATSGYHEPGFLRESLFPFECLLKPALKRIRKHRVVGDEAKRLLAAWYPEDAFRKGKPKLEAPWKPVSHPDLDKAIELSARPVIQPGEEDKFSVTDKFFNSREDKVIVHCEIYHDEAAARGYTMVLIKIDGKWNLAYAEMSWIA